MEKGGGGVKIDVLGQCLGSGGGFFENERQFV